MNRLEDEASFMYEHIKAMKAEGFTFPAGSGPEENEYDYGKGEQKKFPAWQFEVYVPDMMIQGVYAPPPHSQESLIELHRRRVYLLYNVIPRLRFMTRATEMSHILQPNAIPAWFKNVKWEKDFTIPGKRIKWERFKLFQPAVGVQSISILKRNYEKSATVRAED